MDNLQLPIVNEIKVTGRAERRLINKESKLWQRISRWTHSTDVEFNDGKTAEEKVGNINGITSDFSCNDVQIAASATLTNKIHNDLGGCRFGYDEDGNPGVIIQDEDGADTVRPFKSKPIVAMSNLTWEIPIPRYNEGSTTISTQKKIINLSDITGYKKLTADNILINFKSCLISYSGCSITLIDKLYNADTGILTCKFSAFNSSTTGFNNMSATLKVDILVI